MELVRGQTQYLTIRL